tara:strand:- start:2366 stop:2512 length:147 start_codon:yes stop_codon:yes gene_type:complete
MFEDKQEIINNSFYDAVIKDIYEWEKEHGKQAQEKKQTDEASSKEDDM